MQNQIEKRILPFSVKALSNVGHAWQWSSICVSGTARFSQPRTRDSRRHTRTDTSHRKPCAGDEGIFAPCRAFNWLPPSPVAISRMGATPIGTDWISSCGSEVTALSPSFRFCDLQFHGTVVIPRFVDLLCRLFIVSCFYFNSRGFYF